MCSIYPCNAFGVLHLYLGPRLVAQLLSLGVCIDDVKQPLHVVVKGTSVSAELLWLLLLNGADPHERIDVPNNSHHPLAVRTYITHHRKTARECLQNKAARTTSLDDTRIIEDCVRILVV